MTTNSHNFAADGTWSPFVDASEKTKNIEYGISMDGDFGGGTLTITRYSSELAAWVHAASATETGAIRLAVGIDSQFRFVLAGATAPDIDVAFWAIA